MVMVTTETRNWEKKYYCVAFKLIWDYLRYKSNIFIQIICKWFCVKGIQIFIK
jgi:hypothetical protein